MSRLIRIHNSGSRVFESNLPYISLGANSALELNAPSRLIGDLNSSRAGFSILIAVRLKDLNPKTIINFSDGSFKLTYSLFSFRIQFEDYSLWTLNGGDELINTETWYQIYFEFDSDNSSRKDVDAYLTSPLVVGSGGLDSDRESNINKFGWENYSSLSKIYIGGDDASTIDGNIDVKNFMVMNNFNADTGDNTTGEFYDFENESSPDGNQIRLFYPLGGNNDTVNLDGLDGYQSNPFSFPTPNLTGTYVGNPYQIITP